MPDLIAFKGNKEDMSVLLIAAERYALGRRTYIVAWICDIIRDNRGLLTDKDRQVIIRDIERAKDMGDECDEACWKALLKKLKEETANE